MTQVRLQSRSDARGELAMGLLAQRPATYVLRRPIMGLLQWLLRPRTLGPEQPLQRHAFKAPLTRFGHDQPRHIRRKFLTLRPLLDPGLGDRGPELCSELAVRQRDTGPGAEDVQEPSQPFRHGALFRSFSSLD